MEEQIQTNAPSPISEKQCAVFCDKLSMYVSGEVKPAKVGAIQIMESLTWNSNLQNLETVGEALEGFEDGLRLLWK